MTKLIAAYDRLTDAELLSYYELRDLLTPEQVRAIRFVMSQHKLEG